MSHTITVGTFEGPLALLLELIEHGQLEVTSISVAAVTANYLKRVQALKSHDPKEMSEFVQLGTRLLHIKSLALLPQTSALEQEQELKQLNLELAEYRRFQSVATELGRRQSLTTWTRPHPHRPNPEQLPAPTISLNQLAEAFSRALKAVPPARPLRVLPPHLSLATVLSRLKTKLTRQPQLELQTLLDQGRNRLELMLTFLALLELVRAGEATVQQTSQFAPIIIEAAHD